MLVGASLNDDNTGGRLVFFETRGQDTACEATAYDEVVGHSNNRIESSREARVSRKENAGIVGKQVESGSNECDKISKVMLDDLGSGIELPSNERQAFPRNQGR